MAPGAQAGSAVLVPRRLGAAECVARVKLPNWPVTLRAPPDRAVDNWLTEPRRNLTKPGKPRSASRDRETLHLQGKTRSRRPI